MPLLLPFPFILIPWMNKHPLSILSPKEISTAVPANAEGATLGCSRRSALRTCFKDKVTVFKMKIKMKYNYLLPIKSVFTFKFLRLWTLSRRKDSMNCLKLSWKKKAFMKTSISEIVNSEYSWLGVNQWSYSWELDPNPTEILTITSVLILLNTECAITNKKCSAKTKKPHSRKQNKIIIYYCYFTYGNKHFSQWYHWSSFYLILFIKHCSTCSV